SIKPGSGVFIQGPGSSFTMRDDAVIAPGSDVYLPAGMTLTVGSNLTGASPVAAITPETYSDGATVRVLSGDPALITANHGHFSATPDGGSLPWYVDHDGFLKKTPFNPPVLNSPIPGIAQIGVSWSAVPEAGSYEIYYSNGLVPGSADSPQVIGITRTSYTLTGLNEKTWYSVWVRARTGLVVSGWSNGSAAVTLGGSPDMADLPVFRADAGGFPTLAKALELSTTPLGAGTRSNPVVIKILRDLTISGTGDNLSAVVGTDGGVRHTQIVAEGKIISRGPGMTGELIKVDNGGSLVLGDDSGALTLDGKGVNASSPLVYVNNSSLEIKSHVTLQRGFSSGNGGAIRLFGSLARIIMSGGTIKNNAASMGGGVYIHLGTFEMRSGTIGGPAGNGNKAVSGGGVYLDGGEFSMSEDARVEGNSAGEGPGLYYYSGIFSMKDSAVIDEANPVYILKNQTIWIDGALNGSGTVAALIPSDYLAGSKVLSDNAVGALVLLYHKRFEVAEGGGAWRVDLLGKLKN
ncbi:MAG: fibronectin type III domain-containing protein, partial [Treponema sp.]|nr:fibronectin type III domain-containing protein [Treponema sp.]